MKHTKEGVIFMENRLRDCFKGWAYYYTLDFLQCITRGDFELLEEYSWLELVLKNMKILLLTLISSPPKN